MKNICKKVCHTEKNLLTLNSNKASHALNQFMWMNGANTGNYDANIFDLTVIFKQTYRSVTKQKHQWVLPINDRSTWQSKILATTKGWNRSGSRSEFTGYNLMVSSLLLYSSFVLMAGLRSFWWSASRVYCVIYCVNCV